VHFAGHEAVIQLRIPLGRFRNCSALKWQSRTSKTPKVFYLHLPQDGRCFSGPGVTLLQVVGVNHAFASLGLHATHDPEITRYNLQRGLSLADIRFQAPDCLLHGSTQAKAGIGFPWTKPIQAAAVTQSWSLAYIPNSWSARFNCRHVRALPRLTLPLNRHLGGGVFSMSSHNPLSQLLRLDSTSSEFNEQVTDILYGEEYVRWMPNLQGDDLMGLVDYLDEVRLRFSLVRPPSTYSRLSILSTLQAPLSGSVYANSDASAAPKRYCQHHMHFHLNFCMSVVILSPREAPAMYMKGPLALQKFASSVLGCTSGKVRRLPQK